MKGQLQRFKGSGEEVCRLIRKETDTVILAFSCGKDSIGAWLQLRRYFPHIIPFFNFTVPGLEFQERNVRYYEKFFKTKIVRMVAPKTYEMLAAGVFQTPATQAILDRAGLGMFTDLDVHDDICEDLGLPLNTLYATGVRAADSIHRRTALIKNGCLYRNRKIFYPVWDWNIERLTSEIKKAKVKLPYDYVLWGRTFEGLDYRFTGPLKEHYPKDFARLKEFFPLIEADIWRHKYAEAS